ncbi:MAG TPA: type VI secretion system tube protein TssD [Bacteroidales bacterium]|jgi:type VI secretion system Hcp family effector|nr:type VI secretion system tube protein TssD [Bacteroidales bacterium]
MKNFFVTATLFTLLILASSSIVSAQTENLKVIGYATIDGTMQGKLKTDDGNQQSKIKIYGLEYQANQLTGISTNMITGKRQQSPVTITKPLSYCTPQLYQALYTNEVLKSVMIELVKRQTDGSEMVYYTIKLTNATVSKISEKAEPVAASFSNNLPLEEVSFSYQRIEMEHKEGKTMVMDNIGN